MSSIALAGIGTFPACTWQEGDGATSSPDAGVASGGRPDSSIAAGAGGASVAGGGGLGTGGSLAAGGRASGGATNGGAGDGGAANGGAANGGAANGGAANGGAANGGAGDGGASAGGTAGSSGGVDAGAPLVDASSDASVEASPCGPCPSGLCLPSGACAACDPARSDICPGGSYCALDATCVPGCKASGAGCASGKCDASHECTSCSSDAECLGGHVCASGQCLARCGNDDECSGSYSCCGSRCADLARDHLSCGGCGVICSSTEFCGGSACRPGTLSSVCASPAATFLLDGLAVDDPMAQSVRDGIVAPGTGCSPPPSTVLVDQQSSTTVSPGSGRPVVGGGNMQVVLGGPLGQHLVRYLEDQRIAPVAFYYDAAVARFYGRGADGGPGPILVEADLTTVTESHDFFLAETVVDPQSGTLTLVLYGFGAKGTSVAAWYFVNQMLPGRATLDKGFYIYEWTDQDADQQPGLADTFTLRVSGP